MSAFQISVQSSLSELDILDWGHNPWGRGVQIGTILFVLVDTHGSASVEVGETVRREEEGKLYTQKVRGDCSRRNLTLSK
jgi:hypothetical protein